MERERARSLARGSLVCLGLFCAPALTMLLAPFGKSATPRRHGSWTRFTTGRARDRTPPPLYAPPSFRFCTQTASSKSRTTGRRFSFTRVPDAVESQTSAAGLGWVLGHVPAEDRGSVRRFQRLVHYSQLSNSFIEGVPVNLDRCDFQALEENPDVITQSPSVGAAGPRIER